MAIAFNNHRLFSDHFLTEVVPTLEVWRTAHDESAAAQDDLRELFANAKGLVMGHEGQTEEHWIRPVLERLGFSFQVFPAIGTADGVRWPDYALFANEADRLASEADHGTQAYFRRSLAVADAKVWDRQLDQRATAGDPFDRRNPSVQIDYYLRETNTRWAILTNGHLWRVYSRDTSYRLDTYYEVDLVALLEEDSDAFKYFWLFFRKAAFEGQPRAFLDDTLVGSKDFAASLTERVKDRVYAAVHEFVNGFFAYTPNQLDPYRDIDAAFAGALILLYRILFVLYAESRELLPLTNATYREVYSVAALKEELGRRLDVEMALQTTTNTYATQLRNLFRLVSRGSRQLEIPQYNGRLFDDERHPFLKLHDVGDLHLARGLDLLTRIEMGNGEHAFIDYRTLDVRHLGDIYEGLLEYHARYAEEEMVAVPAGGAELWMRRADVAANVIPRATASAESIYLATGKGERRATGSYYTPQSIVAYMVAESIGRRIEELRQVFAGDELAEQILELRVCDPAMGSGHFLVEAVDYIARVLTQTDTNAADAAIDETELQRWRRRVVERCIYGVDQNPLAVELAKLSLWLATVSAGRPLSFLDSHLASGNSLIGIVRLDQLGALRSRGRQEADLFSQRLADVLPQALDELAQISAAASETIDDIHAKEELLARARAVMRPYRFAANAWIAGRFGVDVSDDLYNALLAALDRPRRLAALVANELRPVEELDALTYHFFHWSLEFPEIFLTPGRAPGFDVVITNPPYVNATELNAVLTDYEKPFWRTQFESASGAYDLYVIFTELCLQLTRAGSYASLITPNKYLAAPYASALRAYIARSHRLVQVLDASRVRVFEDPSVYPIVSVFQAMTAQGEHPVTVRKLQSSGAWEAQATHPSRYLALLPDNIWAFLLLDDAELLIRLADNGTPTRDVPALEVVASTTAAEADLYGPHVKEIHLAQGAGWRQVNTGTIERFHPAWGLERMLHQGRRFLRPSIPEADPVSATRSAQYSRSKLVFSKLVTRLTAMVDRDGEYGALNANFILTPQEDVDLYGALFNSRLMDWVAQGYFGALRMAGGYVQIQAPQLRVLPVPRGLAAKGEAQTLRDLGRRRWETEAERVDTRIRFVSALIDALGVESRRADDPAWVPPRQAAMLSALEDPEATDLTRFWTPLRATARDLAVRINAQREATILSAAQEARSTLLEHRAVAERLDAEIDAVVYELFSIAPEDIARIEAGPPQYEVIEANMDEPEQAAADA